MLSVTRRCSRSRLHLGNATPITGTFRLPRFAIAYSAGKIILWARSPVTPKSTSASDRVWVIRQFLSNCSSSHEFRNSCVSRRLRLSGSPPCLRQIVRPANRGLRRSGRPAQVLAILPVDDPKASRQGNFRDIVFIQAVHQLGLRRGQGGLSLNHGKIAIHAIAKTVGRIVHRGMAQVDIAAGHVHQLLRGGNVEHVVANLRLNLLMEVGQLRHGIAGGCVRNISIAAELPLL